MECVRENIEVRFVVLQPDSWCHQDIKGFFISLCEAGCEKSVAPVVHMSFLNALLRSSLLVLIQP